jgi:hypothetical protein
VFHTSAFWSEGALLTKVKSPIEFVNSAVRALGADLVDDDLRDRISDQAMSFFDRDEPDGYSELGSAWVDTLSLLERMRFCQATASNASFGATTWDALDFLADNGLGSTPAAPDEIANLIDHFDRTVFLGTLTEERRAVILDFANTDNAGNPSPFAGLSGAGRRQRLEETVGLILATPEFHYQ